MEAQWLAERDERQAMLDAREEHLARIGRHKRGPRPSSATGNASHLRSQDIHNIWVFPPANVYCALDRIKQSRARSLEVWTDDEWC